MKLYFSAASPFVRKVRIVIREKGLTDQFEEIPTVPLDNDPDHLSANPMAKIPAMIDETGTAWWESQVIAARLDQIGSGPNLLPDYGSEAYWSVRRAETSGQGLIETAVSIVYEGRRAEDEQSPFWISRWHDNLKRGFERANEVCGDADTLDMGSLTLCVAGTYCDFRLPEFDWRSLAPGVAALHELLEQRPSFTETAPK